MSAKTSKATIAKDKLADVDFDRLVLATSQRVTREHAHVCPATPVEPDSTVAAHKPVAQQLSKARASPEAGLPSPQTTPAPSSTSGGLQTAEHNRLNQPKRPMNAFMVWGQAIRRQLHHRFSNVQNALLSKALGRVWRSLDAVDKEPFVRRANVIKANHKRDYPNYRYQPRRTQERRPKSQTLIGICLNHPLNVVAQQTDFGPNSEATVGDFGVDVEQTVSSPLHKPHLVQHQQQDSSSNSLQCTNHDTHLGHQIEPSRQVRYNSFHEPHRQQQQTALVAYVPATIRANMLVVHPQQASGNVEQIRPDVSSSSLNSQRQQNAAGHASSPFTDSSTIAAGTTEFMHTQAHYYQHQHQHQHLNRHHHNHQHQHQHHHHHQQQQQHQQHQQQQLHVGPLPVELATYSTPTGQLDVPLNACYHDTTGYSASVSGNQGLTGAAVEQCLSCGPGSAAANMNACGQTLLASSYAENPHIRGYSQSSAYADPALQAKHQQQLFHHNNNQEQQLTQESSDRHQAKLAHLDGPVRQHYNVESASANADAQASFVHHNGGLA